MPIAGVILCGGEPTLYPGLGEAIEALECPVNIPSNCETHPAKWPMSEKAWARIQDLHLSLQWSPFHPRAERFWAHARWIRQRFADKHITLSMIRTQQVTDAEVEEARLRAAALPAQGFVCDQPGTVWGYREAIPVREMTARCSGGFDNLILLPDGEAFRCLGHSQINLGSLGNVARDGWAVLLPAPTLCTTCVCTRYDLCDKVTTELVSGSGRLLHRQPDWGFS